MGKIVYIFTEYILQGFDDVGDRYMEQIVMFIFTNIFFNF